VTNPPTGLSSQRVNPVLDAGGSQVAVRPAHLDRQLRRTTMDPRYADPHLEELVRTATERARNQAMAEGYASGWAQGRQAAAQQEQAHRQEVEAQAGEHRADLEQQLADLVRAFAEQTRSADAAAEPVWLEVADELGEGALRLATAALGRELRSIDDTVLVSMRDALHQLGHVEDAVVHLNPADQQLLSQTATPGVRIVPDAGVPAGSVVGLTPSQRLARHLPDALAAAEAVLLS
jgi:flagellar assembly protein FliH